MTGQFNRRGVVEKFNKIENYANIECDDDSTTY